MGYFDNWLLGGDDAATAQENQQSAIAYATANYRAGRTTEDQFRKEMAMAGALPTTSDAIIQAAQQAGIETPTDTFEKVASAQATALATDIQGLDPTALVRDLGLGYQGELAAGVDPNTYEVTKKPSGAGTGWDLLKIIEYTVVGGAVIFAGVYFWNLRPRKR